MSGSANGFQRMSLQQLIAMAQTDIETNLRGSNARLPQSNLDALACMSAGQSDEQLEAIEYYATGIHVTTATGIWLERHGAEWGVPRKEATRATGLLSVPVAPNTVVPNGSLFQTRERWRVRTTEIGSSVPGGAIDIMTEALLTGPEGNLEPGTVLQTVNPIAGVGEASVGTFGLLGGNSRELDDPYRSRILDRIQRPPNGGAAHDYIRWMLQYPGCTRAWVSPREQGTGTVVCRFAMDNSYPPNGIPPAGEVERMTQWLDVRRPVTAEVFCYAPVRRPINVTVRDLQPDNLIVRQAVEDELADMLFREGSPRATLHRSWFWEAVSLAAGTRSHVIDEPTWEVFLSGGEIAALGTLTFTQTFMRGRR